VPDTRAVLCLEENVVTGAADGYRRMAGKPAFRLLHVGSGFANGHGESPQRASPGRTQELQNELLAAGIPL